MSQDRPSLSPDDIRTIREGLGLTQREAGVLLGGGPAAFAKYESGTARPSTAFANLLKLLKADPSTLNTLHPERAVPAPGAGLLPFEVAGRHVAALSQQVFPEFVRRLLTAEAWGRGVPLDGIHAADNTNAPDGGEDARIRWADGPTHTSFLPGRFCQFQLKTGKLGPAAAGKEVLAKDGAVKPMLQDGLAQGSHYILLSTHAYTQQMIEKRAASIRAALCGAGLDVAAERIQVRDAGQLAAWANAHPTVALWLLERTEPGLPGPFRSWQHWASRAEHVQSPWVDDARLGELRRFLQEQQMGQPRRAARVVGMVGSGKSRLVLEALPALEPPLADEVLYAVADEVEFAALKAAVQQLADGGTRALVVVDRCAPDTHRSLARMVEKDASRLSLLTLDDEEVTSEARHSHTVGAASPHVIEAIVGHAAPGLQELDRQRIVRFAGRIPGNARVLARAWIDNEPLAHAADNDLVDAYIRGRISIAPDLLFRAARRLAVFGHVRMEEGLDDQLAQIAALDRDLSPKDLREGLLRLVERGIARQRGGYVSIQPGPIALNLAARQWRAWPQRIWDMVLSDLSPQPAFVRTWGLNVLAARQLKALDTLGVARDVVTHVCRYGGPFHGPDGLLAGGHAEVLSHLAEIDGHAVADRLEDSLHRLAEVPIIMGETRKHLVGALGKITFKADTFEEGAHLLLHLAVMDKDDRDNLAARHFESLFPSILGNTEADGQQRLDLLDSLVDDPARKVFVVNALKEGLRLGYFDRLVGPEVQGTRPALASWQPATKEEAQNYVGGCVRRLGGFAVRDDDSGAWARSCLGANLDLLIRDGFIDVVEEVVERVAPPTVVEWPEALRTLGPFAAGPVPECLADRIQALLKRLELRTLEARVEATVSHVPWQYLDTETASYEDLQHLHVEEVQQLAAEARRQPERLRALLPQLCRGRQMRTREFGQILGQTADTGDDWLELIIQALGSVPLSERNYDMLEGCIQSVVQEQPEKVGTLKQRAAQNALLAPILQRLCVESGMEKSDIALLIKALRENLLPPDRLTGAGIWDGEPEAVVPLYDALLSHSEAGLARAAYLMAVHVYQNPNNLDAVCPQVQKMITLALRESWLNEPEFQSHFRSMLTSMLERDPDDRNAVATAVVLSKAVAEFKDHAVPEAVENLMPLLLSRFPDVAWQFIGPAIIKAEPNRQGFFKRLLGAPIWRGHDAAAPILKLPLNALFAWCHAHPDSAPAFAAKTVPFLAPDNHEGRAYCVHPVMVRLIEEFGDRKDVTEAAYGTMGNKFFMGSEESLWPPYLEALTNLLDHRNHRVRQWARTGLRRARRRHKDARRRDDEWDALTAS